MYVQHKPSLGAFAACSFGGSLMTWRAEDRGTDSHGVQSVLQNVKMIQGSGLRGLVVTWGHCVTGADSSAVQVQLRKLLCLRLPPFSFMDLL